VTLDQRRARVFGVLYLITFITSIPALLLYQPMLDDPVGYIAGAGQNNQILFGALLELLLIIANIGTAVVIFPTAGVAERTVAYTLAAIKDWTFLLGPGWVVGWGNGLILGYLVYCRERWRGSVSWAGRSSSFRARSSCSESATPAARCKLS